MELTNYYFKGRIFTGSDFVEDGAIVINSDSGLIVRAGNHSEIQNLENTVDVSVTGATALPGLIDAHMHFLGTKTFDNLEFISTPETLTALRCVSDLRKLLFAGFTSVRDVGSKIGPYLRRAIDEGYLEGPTVISSGRSLAQTGGDDDLIRLPLDISHKLSYSYYADGPWMCRKAVRLVARDGAKVVKVYASGSLDQAIEEGTKINRQFTVEELKAIADEAHSMGLKVAAHAYGEVAIMNSLEAGVDSIEHGVGLTEEVCVRMKKQGTFYVPTLSVYLAIMPKLSPWMRDLVNNHISRDVAMAHKHGVTIVCGTDYGGNDLSPHGQNYREIVELSKIIGNKEALIASTRNGASCLGLSDCGSIKEGFSADLLVVRGNPGEDVEALNPQNVLMVFKKGKLYKIR